MKIGILQTGDVNPLIAGEHPHYDEMFVQLLSPELPEAVFETHALVHGAPTPPADAADAWLITGSKFGVYDAEPWIAPLKALIQEVYAAGRPLIGVCFGHQIMAEALGGRVVKSDKGWGAGLHRYDLLRDEAFLERDAAGGTLELHAMHQDQVVATPPEARVFAVSPFCEVAGLAYGPVDRPTAMSVQGHPEFNAAFERDLIGLRRELGLDAAVAEPALASLDPGREENARVAKWFARFLRAALAA